jgi:L-asparaginase
MTINKVSTKDIIMYVILILLLLYLVYSIYNKKSSFKELFFGYQKDLFRKWEVNSNDNYNVDAQKRKLLLIYTGGTIGMVESKDGNVPKKGYLQSKLTQFLKTGISSSSKEQISDYDIIAYDPLLDSSNMSVKDWNKIIKTINDNYNNYDAFIVIHGTDTLSYTASALSFGFQNLNKPIIVTGSQIPLQKLLNDGWDNLITSLMLASQTDIPEVMVVFDNQVFRGNRSKKISSNKINAFKSPNYPNLGNFGYLTTERTSSNKWSVSPNLNIRKIAGKPRGEMKAILYNEKNEVIVIFLTPGFNPNNIISEIKANPNIRGAILNTFGIGDGPTSSKPFLNMLAELNNHNILILNISQCIEGHIDTGDYETGKTMTKYNLISGNDMTIEAGYAKLLHLMSKYDDSNGELYDNKKNIEKLLVTSMRGELSTEPTSFEM